MHGTVTAGMKDSIVALENIDFGYPGRPLLFSGLSLALTEGEQIGLYGPNGSGKTTLLRLLTGLEKPQRGRLLFGGAPVESADRLWHLRCSIGFVLQNSDDQLFSASVLEEAAFGPLNLGLPRREARERAMEALAELGIEELAQRPPHMLSGGEKKLAALASVLSMRPRALLLDEPTMFLDEPSQARLAGILKRQGLARIIISHDKDFLRETSSLFWQAAPGSGIFPAERPA